jgi:hypothetical protein
VVELERNSGERYCCSDGNRNDNLLDLDGTAFHDRDLGTSCVDGIGDAAETGADFLDNETRIDVDSVQHHIVVHCDVPWEEELVLDLDSVHHYIAHCDIDVPWEEEPTPVVHEQSWEAPSSTMHHRDDNYQRANGLAQEDRSKSAPWEREELMLVLVVHVHEGSWAEVPSAKVHHRDEDYQMANGRAQEDRFEVPELEAEPEQLVV